MNDAKIMKLSLAHLMSIIEKPNYVLRSHSSANARCCFRDLDGNLPKINTDKSILDLLGFLAMGGLLVSGGVFLNYLLSKGK